jgi:DNA modification methylase
MVLDNACALTYKRIMKNLNRKNPAAVFLGRKGGLKGGPARAARLSPEERHISARVAALARWDRSQFNFLRDDGNPVKNEMNSHPAERISTSSASEMIDKERDIRPSAVGHIFATSKIYLTDCFGWMSERSANSIHAIVTDPPYGILEFTEKEKSKLRNGKGGVWRIPPSFDGSKRSPLPRFTILSNEHLQGLVEFFSRWAALAERILVPGAHLFVATNPLLSDLVCSALRSAGLEKRGEIMRLVQTLRGGDRPKNAHEEFFNITVMPRSGFEPWVIFRKPCEGRVQDNLRKWKTGGLRRISDEQPFRDVIPSSPTRTEERILSMHPALKPQAFMRQIVRAALPFGEGILLDPFMGGGSTIASCVALGYECIGLENDPEYFTISKNGIPKLAEWNGNGAQADYGKVITASAKGTRNRSH